MLKILEGLQHKLPESCNRKEFQMPDNKKEIEIKLTDDDVRYDLNKHIYLHTNLGEVKIDFKDALEITKALFDATYHLNTQTEHILYQIEDELIS